MKQQESNQFDKGMNLDLNVINTDNHTLTSALNATMITRNGNEMVLQNDMGNAKVELAYLPSGYVPVGMKEFGGIVYVASYNPLKGTSQIGSFPSPETVINSDETDEPKIIVNPETIFNSKETVNKVIDKIYVKNVLINKELKSGDKFQIIAEKNDVEKSLLNYLENKVFELRAIISGEDGENIDITSTCIKYQYKNTEKNTIVDSIAYCGEQLDEYTLTDILVYNSSTDSYESVKDRKFSLYYNVIKGNNKGKLYLAQKLIVPDFIWANLSISVNKNGTDDNPNNEYVLTFTPEAYKYVDSNEKDEVNWEKFDENNFQYIITVKNNSNIINTDTIDKGKSQSIHINCNPDTQEQQLITYTIKVQYPMGIVSNLKIEDTIDLNKVATGEVEISKFRYFNTIYNLGNQRSYIDFNYIIKPYLDKYDYIESLKLLYIERNNESTTKDDIISQIKNSTNIINFDTPNNYLGSYTFRKYFDSNFAIGKMYIGMLRIKTVKGQNKYQYSDPYIIVTSSTVNSYFFEHPNDSMFTGDEDITFPVDCELEYDIEETELLPQDEPDENNTPNISTTKKDLYQYITTRTETRKISLTCNVKLKDSSLDGIVDVKFNAGTNNEFKKSSSDFNTTGGLTGQNVSLDDLVKLNYNTVCTLSNEDHNTKIDIDLNLESKSVFYGLSGISDENAVDKYKFTYSNENATVLMPYIDRNKLDELEMLFGGQILQSNNNDKLYPTRWISMNFYGKGGLYDTKTNKAGVKLSLVKNITQYVENGKFKDDFGGDDDETLPSVDETTSAQTYVFGDSQTDTSVWNNHCTALNNYLQNRLNIRPSFLPWQASRHPGTNNMMLGHYSAGGNIDYYSGGIYSDADLTKTENRLMHWNCSAKQYSYLFMKSTVDTWLLMVDTKEKTLGPCITYKIETENGIERETSTIHHGGSAIEFAAELFGNILVPKSGQTISYDYYKVSDKNSEYVYSNNYSTDVTGIIELQLTLTQNESNGEFKFPKFVLNNDTYTINTNSKFNSFNQLEIDVDYISPALMNFQNIAMVEGSQITYAINPDNNSHEEINLSQPYLYYNGSIYKCKQTAGYGEKLKNLNPTDISTHIAAAICDRRIEMRKNEFNDIYELLINSNVSDVNEIKKSFEYSKKIWWLKKSNTDSYRSRGIVQNKYQTDFDNSIKDEHDLKLRGGAWTSYFPMFFGRPTFMHTDVNENGGYAGTLQPPQYRVSGQIACRESCLSATYVFDVVTNVFKIR